MDERFTMIHRPFADVNASLPADVELSGMLLDIGFSSPQVPACGFRRATVHSDTRWTWGTCDVDTDAVMRMETVFPVFVDVRWSC